MLLLPDAWTWDCWFVADRGRHHAFYLKASNAWQDPQDRHMNASIGHATSHDLREWKEVADALVPRSDDLAAFDRVATWTGSVVDGGTSGWHLFYTGRSALEPTQRQRIGFATSTDLVRWERSAEPPIEADSRWYEKWGDSSWDDEAWRDPWVYQDPTHPGRWHMLITARARDGAVDDRGVIGHAVSDDLCTWEVTEPWSAPGCGFAQLEVPQLAFIRGRWALVFSCLRSELSASNRGRTTSSGMWISWLDSPIGPWDLTAARPLTDATLYAGKVVERGADDWVVLAFRNGPADAFIGGICDPIPLDFDNLPLKDASA